MRFRDRLQHLSVDKMITIKMDHTEIVSEYELDSCGSGYDLSGHTVMELQVS